MSINAHDSHVDNYEIFISGGRSLGSAEVTLPDLKYMTADIKGAGIGGVITMPSRAMFENLEMTIKWRTVNKDELKFLQHQALSFACYAAQQEYDAGTGEFNVVQHKLEVQGVPKNVNLGKLAPSEVMDTETVISIITLKETLKGNVILEIDKLNYVCKVNGIDLAADLKRALGLI